jgi:hypothetical protein
MIEFPKVKGDNSAQSMGLEPVPGALNSLDPDWMIVTLLPSEKDGADVLILTDDTSRIALESLI